MTDEKLKGIKSLCIDYRAEGKSSKCLHAKEKNNQVLKKMRVWKKMQAAGEKNKNKTGIGTSCWVNIVTSLTQDVSEHLRRWESISLVTWRGAEESLEDYIY